MRVVVYRSGMPQLSRRCKVGSGFEETIEDEVTMLAVSLTVAPHGLMLHKQYLIRNCNALTDKYTCLL